MMFNAQNTVQNAAHIAQNATTQQTHDPPVLPQMHNPLVTQQSHNPPVPPQMHNPPIPQQTHNPPVTQQPHNPPETQQIHNPSPLSKSRIQALVTAQPPQDLVCGLCFGVSVVAFSFRSVLLSFRVFAKRYVPFVLSICSVVFLFLKPSAKVIQQKWHDIAKVI
jgi:hypothetical protein